MSKYIEPCRFYGSARGCNRGAYCKWNHSRPDSVPSCRHYSSSTGCKFGSSCKFRHDELEQSTSEASSSDYESSDIEFIIELDPSQNVHDMHLRSTKSHSPPRILSNNYNALNVSPKPANKKSLLDQLPDNVINLIYDTKLELEQTDLSMHLMGVFHHQFEELFIEQSDEPEIVRSIIARKYKFMEPRLMNDYAFQFLDKIIFMSTSDPPVLFRSKQHSDFIMIDRRDWDVMWQHFELGTNMSRARMRRMRLDVLKMPYDYVNGKMKVHGRAVVTFTFFPDPVIQTVVERVAMGTNPYLFRIEDDAGCSVQ